MEPKLKRLHVLDGNMELVLELEEFFKKKGYKVTVRFMRIDKEYHFFIKR